MILLAVRAVIIDRRKSNTRLSSTRSMPRLSRALQKQRWRTYLLPPLLLHPLCGAETSPAICPSHYCLLFPAISLPFTLSPCLPPPPPYFPSCPTLSSPLDSASNSHQTLLHFPSGEHLCFPLALSDCLMYKSLTTQQPTKKGKVESPKPAGLP